MPQRTKEMEVRAALGAGASHVLLTVLACLQPTLRGLRIQPTEALGET